ncbi:ABC transporter substrate-binding protein [Marinobacterium jannaschii]|uniref:ABC transporter substrate-binding protein n=1 Tax=Marinobacterium jannaschii TaxID=64970 RepID=UPI0004889623|nr:ABC transporter substrate-binding protein [Marinobacterium jannaschii]
MKYAAAVTLSTLASLFSSGISYADNPLTVVAFGGASQEAQRQVFFKPYEQRSGIRISEQSYNGGLSDVKTMIENNNVRWDVIQMEDPDLISGCKKGYFEPINWSRLGGQQQFLPSAVSRCGVGHIVWSTVLSYDKQRFPAGPSGWSDFWDTQRFPGNRGMRQGPRGNLEYALMADGVPPEKVYVYLETKTGQDRAFAKLDQLKPYIKWWKSGSQPPQWLENGEVAMTTAYNGRITNANKAGNDFRIVWDEQMFSVDSWAIISGSPNRSAAMDFIAFASSPEVSARYPTLMPYGVTNREAIKAIPPQIAANLPTHPDNTVRVLREDSQFWIDHQEQLGKRFERWLNL